MFVSRILSLCISQKWDVIIFTVCTTCASSSLYCVCLIRHNAVVFLKIPMLFLQFDSVIVLCSLNKQCGC